MPNRVKILKEKFVQSLGLPFQELLPESAIQQVINELKIKYRCRLFDPIVLSLLTRVGEGVEIPSTDSSAYCPCPLKITRRIIAKALR